jgi:heat shock protein HslJ
MGIVGYHDVRRISEQRSCKSANPAAACTAIASLSFSAACSLSCTGPIRAHWYALRAAEGSDAMTIKGPLVLLLFLIASTTDAQQPHPSGFPIGRLFTLISIDGQAVTERHATMTITLAGNGNPMAAGFGGCRGWYGQMGGLQQGKIKFEIVATTAPIAIQEPCGPDHHATEQKFIAALESATRWQLDADTLIVQGDGSAGILRMTTEGR